MRSKYFIVFMAVLFICACKNKTEETISRTKSNEIKRNNSWKEVVVGDSIRMKVPQSWKRVEAERFAFKANCEEKFCENVVVYTMDNINQYTRRGLGEVFVSSVSSNYNNFKLIHSEISTPDSSRMYFDYLLTKQGLILGGTTYIYIRGNNKAVIFSFMGYNGPNGDYVTVREIITKVVETVEFK